MAYYIDELREAYRYVRIISMLDTIKEPLDNHDTAIVLKLIAGGVETIHAEVTELLDERLNDTGEERMSYYQSLTTVKGLLGWPTGFPSMDEATSGLQKGQLITLAGTTKVKKSMLLMCMNIAANQAGAKTMYISFEMSNREQATRHDALRAGVSLTRLQHGRHTPDEHTKLNRMMHELEDRPALVLVHDPTSTTTVSAIRAKIAQHRPDAVYIDGAYMMDSEDPGVTPNSPQALTSITRSLKRMAQQTDVPIVQTTQALTWKTPKGKLSVNSIGYSSSFGQDSDVVFGVESVLDKEGQISDQETLLRILASRNCSPRDVRLTVDLDRGFIVETDEVKFEDDDPDEG
jgi:replicative DNA helicase